MVTIAAIERVIKRITQDLYRRTRLSVLRTVINSADDTKAVQQLQIDLMEGQTRDQVEHLQPLGITSVPARDAEAVALAVGGNQDHTVVLGVQDRTTRPTGLSEGETKVYSAHGNTLYLNAAGECVLEDSTGSKVTLTSAGNIDAVQSGTLVNLASASDFAARASLADARFTNLETAFNLLVAAFNAAVIVFNAHQHSSTTVWKPGTPGVDPTVTVVSPTTPQLPGSLVVPTASTAATNVKIS